jgi:hypothetical protein
LGKIFPVKEKISFFRIYSSYYIAFSEQITTFSPKIHHRASMDRYASDFQLNNHSFAAVSFLHKKILPGNGLTYKTESPGNRMENRAYFYGRSSKKRKEFCVRHTDVFLKGVKKIRAVCSEF